jgi:hypothetical protein
MELTMMKIKHLLLAVAVGVAIPNLGLAQEPRPAPAAGASDALVSALADTAAQDGLPMPLPAESDAGIGGGVLEALPRPRVVPSSLFAPVQPRSGEPMPIGGPYFQTDPFLDPPEFPQPGWFGGAEAQIVKPHLITRMENSVIAGKFVNNAAGNFPMPGHTSIVDLPSAPLSWTAAPRVFGGYRLPSGFGEFMVAYRNLASSGSGTGPGTNGPVDLGTRFKLNMIDFDYNSRELSLWPQWDMKWSFGLRTMFLNWAAQGTQPFNQAPLGGVFQARSFNNNFSLGPHAALQLERHLGDSGWSLSTRVDAAGLFGYLSEGWLTKSGGPGPAGQPQVGETRAFGHQASPMFTGRLGLNWQPSPDSGTKLFVGYQYDVIWDLNRILQNQPNGFSPGSSGQFWDQGIVLQATFRY